MNCPRPLLNPAQPVPAHFPERLLFSPEAPVEIYNRFFLRAFKIEQQRLARIFADNLIDQ